MADRDLIDVDVVVDRQHIGSFTYRIVFWSFLIMLMDGWDIVAAGVAVPSLIRDWQVKPFELGPMLAANNFGVLFGAPLFGWFGDRFGRKPAIILAAVVFGSFTIGGALSHSLDQLQLMRFLGGFGIAGVMANTIALNAEMAPARMRATLIIIMFMGNTFGGSLPGFFGPSLVPAYGWQVLFYIGGIVPLVIAALLVFALPESIKFLCLDARNRDRAAALARRLDPQIDIGPQARFVTRVAEQAGAVAGGGIVTSVINSITGLFRGPFAIITPLIWILFAINLMVFYFVNTWTPAVLGDVVAKAGGSRDSASTALGAFQLAGTFGGVVLTRFLDKFGLRPVLGLIIVALPVTAAMGWFAEQNLLVTGAAIAGFCLLGIQFGLNASAGIIYPTEIRSNGVGWAFGIGRFGAVLGPFLGAYLLGQNYSIGALFIFVAAPLLISLVACLLLIRLHDTSQLTAEISAPARSH